MTKDPETAAQTSDIPELHDLLRKNPYGVISQAPRYVMHEGRLYDLSKKFDQNCVKMHAQRFHAAKRATRKAENRKPMNRHMRRAMAAKGV